jgi:hypothetical protein
MPVCQHPAKGLSAEGQTYKACGENTTATEMNIEFTMKWTQYEWLDAQSQLNTIPCDNFPVVSKAIFTNLHSGLPVVEREYVSGGIRVEYNLLQMDQEPEPNEFINNTLGLNGDTRPVDTVKVFCFTKSPPTVKSALTAIPSEIPVTTEKENNLHCFIGSGFFKLDELATCLRGDVGHTPLTKRCIHNFTTQCLQIEISDAVVHVNGNMCTSGDDLKNRLTLERTNGRLRTSLMHTMQKRSELINTNLELFGAQVMQSCTIRENSIGGMMGNPISMGQMHKESYPLFMMGDMYKSDFGSLCPELAVHFATHSHNITGTTPHDATLGRKMFKNTYSMPRRMTTKQMLNVVHTCYQAPCFSAELTPYTSDLVLNIAPETVASMCDGTFPGTWGRRDFVQTECIDNAFSMPNDTEKFRANDCEGSAAMIICMQSNLRAVFHESTRYLSNCNTLEGQQALSAWLERCNVNLDEHMHYAFAVQLTAMSAVAHMATDLKTIIVGAQCATPLQEGQEKSTQAVKEQGHCCCLWQANEKSIDRITSQIYDYYAHESNAGCVLKLPDHTASPTTSGQIDTTNTKNLRRSPVMACGITDDNLKDGFHVLWPAIASKFPHQNVAATSSFYMVESTTCLHWCPVRGHIALAKMQGMYPQRHGPSSTTPTGSVPVEEFVKAWQLKDMRPYIHATEDVRLQGFMHSPSDGNKDTMPFYKTFYQMDGYALHQIDDNGNIQIGADAMQLLNSITDPGTRLLMEKIQLPCLSAAENAKISNQMHAQWVETRLPSMGRKAVCDEISSWHAATINVNHAPEDVQGGVVRCNISISGEGASQLYTDMSPGGQRAIQFAANDHGIVADMRLIAIGKNTTIISQSIRVNHLEQSSVKTVNVKSLL